MDATVLLAMIGDREVQILQLRQRIAELEAQINVDGKVDSGLQPSGRSEEADNAV